MRRSHWICFLTTMILGRVLSAQEAIPALEGMWSDLPATAENSVCFLTCTDESIAYMKELLADPVNLDRPYLELQVETWQQQINTYTPRHLTPTALERYPFDMAQDPGLVDCEPWGFARQIFVPHQLEITQHDDRIEMHYAEWDTVRTIYLDGREPPQGPPTRLGFSAGRYENGVLVVETSGVRPGIFEGITLAPLEHSDQLTAVERYTLSEAGNRLDLVVVYEDPLTFREPLTAKKGWAPAPDEQIFEYVCEVSPQ